MIKLEVLSEEKNWSKRIKKKEIFFKSVCKSFPKKYRVFNKKLSLTLLLSNNKSIKKLNKKFRNKNKSTDVLSFPFHNETKLKYLLKNEKEIYLGDIIINFNEVGYKNNLKLFKSRFDKLWVHGLVHLFGHDHKSEKDFKKLRRN